MKNECCLLHREMILKAKKSGVKFTFGSSNNDALPGKLDYPVRMKTECGLTPSDMFQPRIKI